MSFRLHESCQVLYDSSQLTFSMGGHCLQSHLVAEVVSHASLSSICWSIKLSSWIIWDIQKVSFTGWLLIICYF